jgi:hypothetical protein
MGTASGASLNRKQVRAFPFLARRPIAQNLVVIVATCQCLCACTQIIDSASTDTATSQRAAGQEQGAGCAKASELREGMTTAQILSVCERKPQRTSDMITRDGKKLTVWVYGSTSLQLTDDKIIKIFGP